MNKEYWKNKEIKINHERVIDNLIYPIQKSIQILERTIQALDLIEFIKKEISNCDYSFELLKCSEKYLHDFFDKKKKVLFENVKEFKKWLLK